MAAPQWESAVVGWHYAAGSMTAGLVIPTRPRVHNGGARYVADSLAWPAGGRLFRSKREAMAAVESAAALQWGV